MAYFSLDIMIMIILSSVSSFLLMSRCLQLTEKVTCKSHIKINYNEQKLKIKISTY
jgi:hypothetical protein